MNERIVIDPEICGGEPCIRGTRIPVHIILSHLPAGENYEEILKNFPKITCEDILACLEYASYLATEKVVALWNLYKNVSFSVVRKLRALGYNVIAIAEEYASIKDQSIYEMAIREKAILITRDYHFTNSLRYPPEKTEGIVYIRHGNLKSNEEVDKSLNF